LNLNSYLTPLQAPWKHHQHLNYEWSHLNHL
jgi:hypothetical protein